MKLAKKFLSVAAVLAMGTCVYTVPVFAEDQASNVQPTPVEEETGDGNINQNPGSGNGNGNGGSENPGSGNDNGSSENPGSGNDNGSPENPGSGNGNDGSENEEPPTIDLKNYVTYGTTSITYKNNQVRVEMIIKNELPADLIYEVTWPSGTRKLLQPSISFNGTPITNFDTKNLTYSEETATIEEETATPDSEIDEFFFENETESVKTRKGIRITIGKDDLTPKSEKDNNLVLTYNLESSDNSSTQPFELSSKLYLAGHVKEGETEVVNKDITVNAIGEYEYNSYYDGAANTLTLNMTVPEAVYTGNDDLSMMIGTLVGVLPNSDILQGIQSLKIGKKTFTDEASIKKFTQTSLDDSPLLEDLDLSSLIPKATLLKITSDQIAENMNKDNDTITIVFKTGEVPSNATVCAYSWTSSLRGKEAYTSPIKNYTITGVYNADLNTWTVGVQPSSTVVADSQKKTVITITSNPNVMTKLDSLVIGTTEVLNDTTGESTDKTTQSSEDSSTASSENSTQPSSSNEAGETFTADLKKISNGYAITVSNANLQDLKSSDWIKAQFSVEENFDTSKMEVTAESGDYKSGTYEKEIKAEIGDTNNATFKGSHDYDSSKQTWTVNLAMTGRPDKLDLTFTQTEGTALGKPTSITVDGKAVSPTVNTKMSGSTMSECTVDFRKEDLDLIKADSKVTLVFPIDGSKEQSERILMNVDLGSSSKDLSAKFTVKKSSTPSSSSNVNTATETNMNTIIIVMVVALAAFAIFGVLAFKKKKTK